MGSRWNGTVLTDGTRRRPRASACNRSPLRGQRTKPSPPHPAAHRNPQMRRLRLDRPGDPRFEPGPRTLHLRRNPTRDHRHQGGDEIKNLTGFLKLAAVTAALLLGVVWAAVR